MVEMDRNYAHHGGNILQEIGTGQGKTVIAALVAICQNVCLCRDVHVITTTDELAASAFEERDAKILYAIAGLIAGYSLRYCGVDPGVTSILTLTLYNELLK